jgi:hypothetical protein
MTPLIKEFVETNIEIIEDNKWFLLFMNWYNNPHKEFPDTNEWNELIEVLQHIDKNILETTKTHREGVIITITRATIDDIKRNQDMWAKGKQITLNFLLMDLYSTLGLSEDELIDCINQAAEAEGLKFNSAHGWFTWS